MGAPAGNVNPQGDASLDMFAPPPAPQQEMDDFFGAPEGQAPEQPAVQPNDMGNMGVVMTETAEVPQVGAPLHEDPLAEAAEPTYPELEKFEAEFERKVEEKKAAEEKLIIGIKNKAEEDIDRYYNERTDKLAHRAATNREAEEEKIKTQELLLEKASEQPWTRVVDLIDLNKDKSKGSSDKKERTSSTDASSESDTSRMKSVLLQLKNSGGVSK